MPKTQVLVVQQVFGAKRTNLHEKYVYPFLPTSSRRDCSDRRPKACAFSGASIWASRIRIEWPSTFAYSVSPSATPVTIAAPGGLTDIHATKHDVPSTEQCHVCHDGVKDGAIGPSLYQLSKQQIDGKPALAELFARGLLDKKIDEIDPPGTGTVHIS